MNLKSLLSVFSNHHNMKVEILNLDKDLMRQHPRLNMGAFGFLFDLEVVNVNFYMNCLSIIVDPNRVSDRIIKEFTYLDLLKVFNEDTQFIFKTNDLKFLNSKVSGINCYDEFCLEVILHQ